MRVHRTARGGINRSVRAARLVQSKAATARLQVHPLPGMRVAGADAKTEHVPVEPGALLHVRRRGRRQRTARPRGERAKAGVAAKSTVRASLVLNYAGPNMTCPSCSIKAPAEAKFCPRCGTPLTPNNRNRLDIPQRAHPFPFRVVGTPLGCMVIPIIIFLLSWFLGFGVCVFPL